MKRNVESAAGNAGCTNRIYLLVDEAAPPDPLDAADPPLVPPLLLDAAPPLGADDELPMPLEELPGLGLELELDEDPGELGVVVDDEDDEPPGTTTVSFSLVVLLLDEPLLGAVLLPPGTTVVSFFSQADKAKAPNRTNR